MSDNHTQEPWQIFDWQNNLSDINAGDVYICTPTTPNAKRIVACVNICEGISTEILENSPDFASAFLSAENSNLIVQNRELTNSLKGILGLLDSCFSDGVEIDGNDEAIMAARVALESAVSV